MLELNCQRSSATIEHEDIGTKFVSRGETDETSDCAALSSIDKSHKLGHVGQKDRYLQTQAWAQDRQTNSQTIWSIYEPK